MEIRSHRLAPWARLAICVAAAARYCSIGAAEADSPEQIARPAAVAAAGVLSQAESGQNPLAQMFDAGQRALLSGDYPTAYRLLRNAAGQGHAQAQSALGGMYLAGQGVAADDAEAFRWYGKAAAQGNAEAQTSLGLMYAEGRGVPQDDAEAAQWWRQGAGQGNAMAQHHLGVALAEGRGVDQDRDQALKWLTLSARQGFALARGYLWANGNITVEAKNQKDR